MDSDCSHEIKRHLLLGKKATIHLDRVFKSSVFSWAPKSLPMVTAAMKLKDTCSLEEKLDSILKSRDITLTTKVHPVKAMVFPVVMYGFESWTIKKAERQRIDAFELWC